MEHETKRFSFSKSLISGCTALKDFGWGGPKVIWSEDISKEKRKEILKTLKEAFKNKIVFEGKHYIASKELQGTTYTRYSGFTWESKYSGLLSCTATTLTISNDGKNSVFVDKERIFIDPNFTVTLMKSIDALSEIRAKFDSIINQVINWKIVR